MELGLSENAKKYIGYGLIAVGVGVGGYAIWKFSKKKKPVGGTQKKSKALSGVGKKPKSKKTKKLKMH